jgi:hypothetical protein
MHAIPPLTRSIAFNDAGIRIKQRNALDFFLFLKVLKPKRKFRAGTTPNQTLEEWWSCALFCPVFPRHRRRRVTFVAVTAAIVLGCRLLVDVALLSIRFCSTSACVGGACACFFQGGIWDTWLNGCVCVRDRFGVLDVFFSILLFFFRWEGWMDGYGPLCCLDGKRWDSKGKLRIGD